MTLSVLDAQGFGACSLNKLCVSHLCDSVHTVSFAGTPSSVPCSAQHECPEMKERKRGRAHSLAVTVPGALGATCTEQALGQQEPSPGQSTSLGIGECLGGAPKGKS